MAVIRQIQVRNRTYTVADDVKTVYRALMTGMIRDEITGEPPRIAFTIRVDRDGVEVKTMADGLFCISGYAERVFPSLSSTSYSVGLVIAVPDYKEVTQTIVVPMAATFPVNVPTVQLRRLPIRLQGRVVEDTTARDPIPNASVLIVNPPPSPPAPPLTEYVVALRSPLSFDHASGVSALDATGTIMNLARKADAGDGVIFLTGEPSGTTIEILDPSGEIRNLGALTDAAGYYRLNGIGRVKTMQLEASTSSVTSPTVPWTINYQQAINIVDFQLQP